MNFLDILTAALKYIDIPALVLLVTLVGAWGIIHKAQNRQDFDFGNMLKDDNNKESVARLGALAAIGVSGWAVMYDTIHNQNLDATTLGIYLAVWSGTKVADKLADALLAKWSK